MARYELKMATNMKQSKSLQQEAKSSRISYDPETFSYRVSESEQRRLQNKYPYDDILTAIIQAGRPTPVS